MRTKEIYASTVTHDYMNLYIAASTQGIVFIGTHHSSIEDLIYHCKKQFPHSEIIFNEKFIEPYAKQLIEYFNKERVEFELPFDINGTTFQRKVWDALCDIPYGTTVSYSDIANKIQNPKAVRAVGVAIGSNPLSIVIPCHRVIGKNGSLTGYNGGLDVKKRLLALENIPY